MVKDYNSILPGNKKWLQMYLAENYIEKINYADITHLEGSWGPHSCYLSNSMGGSIGTLQYVAADNTYAIGQATTADGLQFSGNDSFSYVDCGDGLFNYTGPVVISFRFRLSQSFTGGLPPIYKYLWSQSDDQTGVGHGGNPRYCIAYLDDDGTLTVDNITGGATETAKTTQTNWNARQWYHISCVLNPAAGNMEIYVDGINNTDPATGLVCSTSFGNMVNDFNFTIGNYFDDSAGNYTVDGVEAEISDFVIITDDVLTGSQYNDIAAGFLPLASAAPPAVFGFYRMDKGRGILVCDRIGSMGNGTMGNTVAWAYSSVRTAVISTDGYETDMSGSVQTDRLLIGDKTLIWAGKIKSTYSGVNEHDDNFVYFGQPGQYYLLRYNLITGNIGVDRTVDGVPDVREYAANFNIDDYAIFIYTYRESDGTVALYENGILQDSNIGVNTMVQNPSNIAIAYDMVGGTTDSPGISKPILTGLVDGYMTSEEVALLTARINNRYGLGL